MQFGYPAQRTLEPPIMRRLRIQKLLLLHGQQQAICRPLYHLRERQGASRALFVDDASSDDYFGL